MHPKAKLKIEASIQRAENMWQKASHLAECKNLSSSDLNSFCISAVKSVLGLKDEDLILNGAPLEEVVSQKCFDEMTSSSCAGSKEVGRGKKLKKKVKKESSFDSVIGAIVLTEFCKVLNGDASNVATLSAGQPAIRPTFYSKVRSVMSEKYTIEDLRALFPTARDEYIAFLMTLNENYSLEDLKKFFPGIDVEYVRVLAESTVSIDLQIGDKVSLPYDRHVSGTIIRERKIPNWPTRYLVRWDTGLETWEKGEMLQYSEGDDWD